MTKRDRLNRLWCSLILATHVILVVHCTAVLAPTVGEVGHMVAGISHWSLGKFGLFRVNPPLTRLIGTLPVVLSSPRYDWHRVSTDLTIRSEWVVGEDFIAANHERAPQLFRMARWACIPLSLLGACICAAWANQLYGSAGGYVALLLWCFSPSILAHACMLGPDLGTAAIGVATAYFFWKWLQRPSFRAACVAGLMLGLAELTKLTWIVLFLLWPILWLGWNSLAKEGKCEEESKRKDEGKTTPCSHRAILQLGLIILLALYLINLGYGFAGTFTKLGKYEFVSETLGGKRGDPYAVESGWNRFAGTWLGSVRIPLPRDYVMGIDRQKWDFERGLPSYLNGEWRAHGWWYYYLYAAGVKMPLGTWAILLLAGGVTLCVPRYNARLRDEMVLLAPGLVILIFVSSQTGFSVHSRYAISALPFFFIWASKVARVLEMRRVSMMESALRTVAVVALTWSVSSSLWMYPHSLSYFNELAGGPRKGGEHLLDSNIDWGQDLFFFRDWLAERPEVALDGVAIFGSYPFPAAGIPQVGYPPGWRAKKSQVRENARDETGPVPGWYALSVNHLYDEKNQFGYFLHLEPVAMAGYSIYVYHITLDEANRVRRELGLAELDREGNIAEGGYGINVEHPIAGDRHEETR